MPSYRSLVITLAAASSTRPSRLRRFLSGGVVALVTGGLLATGMTTVASAAVSPSLTVRVQAHGADVAGVDVAVYGTDGYEYPLAEAQTNASGVAVIDGDEDLQSGVGYVVAVTRGYDTAEGFEQYSNGFINGTATALVDDFASGSPVVLAAGGNARTVSLQTGATITGDIYSPSDELFDQAETATAWRKSVSPGTGKVRWDREGSWNNFTEAGAVSDYSIAGLRAGDYVIGFTTGQDGLADTAFNSGYSGIDFANPVSVTRAGPNAIDGKFVPAASISGHVAVPSGWVLAENDAFVSATQVNPDGTPDLSGALNYPGANVDTDGNYVFDGLAAGDYLLEFHAPEGSGLFSEWYDNAASIGSATSVATGSTNVNATIGTGFTLTVSVSSGSGPVSGARVSISAVNDFNERSVVSDFAGKAVFSELKPDDYRVEVEYPGGEFERRYVTSDGIGTTEYSDLDLVTGVDGNVSAGVTFPGVANTVVTITDPAGKPLTSGSVEAVRVVNGARVFGDPWIPATKVAGKSGVYSFRLDTDTDYTILVDTYPATTAFAQYLGGTPAFGDDAIANAKTFNSGTGGAFAFQLAGPGKISGKVVTTSKKALQGVAVSVFEYNGTDWVRSTGDTTSKSGAYTIPVRPGSYKVGFSTAGGPSNKYVGDYVYNETDLDSLATVYVGKNATATVNKSLALGGSLSGTATTTAGTAAARVYVTAVKVTDGATTPWFGTYGYTSAKGVFTISGLPTGTYALSFDDNNEGRVGDTFTQSGAVTTYKVTAGKATKIPGKIQLPSFDAPRTATVSGSLAPAVPGVNGYVDFISTDGLHFGRADLTGAGNFTIALIPGEYQYALGFGSSNAVEYRPLTGTVTVAAGQTTLSLQAIQNNPLAFITAPTIEADGTAVGASTLTAVAEWDHDRAQARYQWLRDSLPIFGATGSSYTPRGGDVGSSIAVRVTLDNGFSLGSEDHQTAVATTVGVSITTGAALELTGTPVLVVTTPRPGGVVRVGATGWLPAGATPVFTWYRDGELIADQTASTYTILTTDIGATISAGVAARRAGRANSETAVTDWFIVQKNPAPTVVKKPTVTATTRGVAAGSTKYTVTPGTWSVAGTTAFYQWFLDDEELEVIGNTFTTTTPATAEALWVRVSAAKPTYDTSMAFDVLVRKGTAGARALFEPFAENLTTEDELSNETPVVAGTQLSARAAFDADAGSTNAPTYVWQRQTGTTWAAIPKATGVSYTVTAADAGKALRVLISSSAPYYATKVYPVDAGVGELKMELVQERADGISIVGTGAVSSTLSARIAPSEGALQGVKNAYQWGTQAGNVFTPISKATKSTFVVPASLLGKEIRVRVTATKADYATSVERSHGVIATTGTITIAEPTVIAGTAKVAVALTAKPAIVDVTGTKRSYVWQVAEGEEWVAISGATGSAYTPTVSMAGRYVRVVETITKALHTTVTSTSQVVGVDSGTLKLATAPKLTTTAAAYTVSAGAATPTASVTYEWLVDGYPDGNQTSSFIRSSSDAGKMIGVLVTYQREGYNPLEVYVAVVKGTGTINGQLISATVGQPVQGGIEEFNNPSGVDLRYPTEHAIQWLLDGKPIKGATDSGYVPTPAQAGKTLTVSATYSSLEFDSGRFVSNPVVVGKGIAAQNGIALESASILAGSSASSVEMIPQPGFTVGYQWYRSTGGPFVAIPKATKMAYATLASDAGTELSLRVTYTRVGYETATYTVGSVSVVGSDGLEPITAPTLTGTGAAATELSVTAGTWTVAPTLSYQWFRDDIAIPGATTAKYTPLGDHLGDTVYAKVTAKRAGFQTYVAQTNGITITHGAPATATVAPKLTGAATTCSTLTVTSGSWAGDGLTFTYAWYRVNGSKELIAGATTSSYTTTPEDLGYVITAVVGAQKTGHGTAGGGASTTALVEGCDF